ncbi:hypothetical protein C8R47DRAFT_305806 [Mycena vitilis]|nr:hypothetical protein C8R47DRAFT_305806 [Mycena vitilis]
MSPALLRRSSTSHPNLHVLSARSAVVTSLNGWQIFGIAIIVIILALLIGGWFWYQKRSARRAHPTTTGAAADDSAEGHVNNNSKGTITTAEVQDVALHDLARPPSWISHYGTGPAHPPHPPQPDSNLNANPNPTSNVPWPTHVVDSNALRLQNMVRADADGMDSAGMGAAMTMGSPGAMTGAEKAGVVPAESRVENAGSVVGVEGAPILESDEGGKRSSTPPSPNTKAAPPPAPSTTPDAAVFEPATTSTPSPPPASPAIKQEGNS